ncbi:velvet factor [Polychytrium aggregatum]|uniref:velvet factor n=1 Tax=Polychytrium aggregatum TaxID=110093 RepID=UPI0022FDBF39|nr:velvet factor [Polychytrium aggregatum]KAI9190707.1 velvet factor [Polychytrium aggregatum]
MMPGDRPHYVLQIVDQPERVRCSGFGPQMYGRPISPAPILQLFRRGPGGALISDPSSMIEASGFVVHIQLYSSDGTADLSLVVNPIRLKEAVPVNPVSPALLLKDIPAGSNPDPCVAWTPPPDVESSDIHMLENEAKATVSLPPSPIPKAWFAGNEAFTQEDLNTDGAASLSITSRSAPHPAWSSTSVSTDQFHDSKRSHSRHRASEDSVGLYSHLGLSSQDQSMKRLLPFAQPSLFGNLVSSSIFSKSADSSKAGVFFAFDKVYIRVEGTYRLKFTLVDLSDPRSLGTGCSTVSTVLSDPFVSHGWKSFPGMIEPSSVLKTLARGGVRATRKVRNKRNGARDTKVVEFATATNLSIPTS